MLKFSRGSQYLSQRCSYCVEGRGLGRG